MSRSSNRRSGASEKKLSRDNISLPHGFCPDLSICAKCPDSKDCMYFRNQQTSKVLLELQAILERRVKLASTCLVNIRNVSRMIQKSVDLSLVKISKIIDETLNELKAEPWGNACSKHRLEKWNIRPISSKIYQIDEVTLENLSWYIDRAQRSLGRWS